MDFLQSRKSTSYKGNGHSLVRWLRNGPSASDLLKKLRYLVQKKNWVGAQYQSQKTIKGAQNHGSRI
jgi:hypothetical protein